jgi:1-acyl-sn-glycerol-3-phosphate acyltransferase
MISLLYYARLIAVCSYFLLFCFIALAFTCIRPFHGNNTRIVLKLLRPAYWIMNLKVIAINKPNVTGPVVYTANHQDLLDVFFFAKIWPNNCAGVGKQELAWIPVFGLAFWLAGNIYIHRGNKDKAHAVVDQMADKINSLDRSIFIMPEGTRSRGKGLLPFKKGAFLTAIKAGVPIVPMCVSSTKNITLSDWAPKPGLVEFLAPISTEGFKPEDAERLALECHELMKAKIAELDKRLEHEF